MSHVTVVIPCYNAGRWLPETLRSVADQTWPGVRVIAVDDGSTDNTPQVLATHQSRVTVLQHSDRQNRGQASSLNLGIAHAGTPYVALLDADDLWYPRKLERQVQALDATPEAVLCYCNADAIGPNGRVLYQMLPPTHAERGAVGRVLLNCYIPSPSSVVVRIDALRRAGSFDPRLRACSDHDMWVRLSELGPFIYINQPLIGYRRHEAQQSRQRHMWEDGFIVVSKAAARYPYPRHVIRHRRAVIHYRLGECDWPIRRVRALWHFTRAALLDPRRTVGTVYARLRGGV